jgi:hypothetical protein
MRKWFLVGVVLLLVVSVPVAVMATGSSPVKPAPVTGSGDLTSQAFSARVNPITIPGKTWTDLPNMSIGPICAFGAVTATLSVSVTGARAGYRVLIDSGAPLYPGAAFIQGLDAGATETAYSYSFEINAGTFEGSDAHTFSVQWRSTGGSTTLENGSVVVQYGDPGTCV